MIFSLWIRHINPIYPQYTFKMYSRSIQLSLFLLSMYLVARYTHEIQVARTRTIAFIVFSTQFMFFFSCAIVGVYSLQYPLFQLSMRKLHFGPTVHTNIQPEPPITYDPARIKGSLLLSSEPFTHHIYFFGFISSRKMVCASLTERFLLLTTIPSTLTIELGSAIIISPTISSYQQIFCFSPSLLTVIISFLYLRQS